MIINCIVIIAYALITFRSVIHVIRYIIYPEPTVSVSLYMIVSTNNGTSAVLI